MHDIEPFFNWRHLYISEDDRFSPFFRQKYSHTCTHTVYNYYIHPQWDYFGSNTLYLKILYTDYTAAASIIELIGEWNDLLYNDIMFLKRNVIEPLIKNGINKFILIGENVLNFHYSDYDYYEEWAEDVDDGWITCIGFLPHVFQDLKTSKVKDYITIDEDINNINWRTIPPKSLIFKINSFYKLLE